MRAALTMDVLATDLADYLVRKGVSFIMTVLEYQFLWNISDPLPRDPPRFWSRGCPC